MSKIKFYDWIFQNACRAHRHVFHRWLQRYFLMIVLTTRKQLLFGALGEDLSEKPEGSKDVWGNANLCIIKTSLPKGGPPGPPQSPGLCCLPIGLKEASGLENWEFWHEFDFPSWVLQHRGRIHQGTYANKSKNTTRHLLDRNKDIYNILNRALYLAQRSLSIDQKSPNLSKAPLIVELRGQGAWNIITSSLCASSDFRD